MKALIIMALLGVLLGGCGVEGNEQLERERPYYDEWVDYTAEELQDVFWEHEAAFDYIAQVLLSLDGVDGYIVIDSPQNGELLFYQEDPNRLFIDNDLRITEYTDGSDLGYVKDELFEQYVNEILIEEKFSVMLFSPSRARIYFGHNRPIYYDASRNPYGERADMWGDLKENWFYYIQSYI